MSKTKAGVLVVTPRCHSASNSMALCNSKKSLLGFETDDWLLVNASKSFSQKVKTFGIKLIMMFDDTVLLSLNYIIHFIVMTIIIASVVRCFVYHHFHLCSATFSNVTRCFDCTVILECYI